MVLSSLSEVINHPSIHASPCHFSVSLSPDVEGLWCCLSSLYYHSVLCLNFISPFIPAHTPPSILYMVLFQRERQLQQCLCAAQFNLLMLSYRSPVFMSCTSPNGPLLLSYRSTIQDAVLLSYRSISQDAVLLSYRSTSQDTVLLSYRSIN